MKRPSLLRPVLLHLLLAPLLLCSSGCVTAGLWNLASEANEPTAPRTIHRARLSAQLLELVVAYGEAGPHLVRVYLDQPTRGFWHTFALHPGELLGEREADLPTPHLECVESPGDLGAEAWAGSGPSPSEAPSREPSAPPRVPAPPRPPTLYFGAGDSSGIDMVACLRREGQDPVYLRIPARPSSGVAPLAYGGAVLATPVTFAVDVVTFPVQVIVLIVILDGITSICD